MSRSFSFSYAKVGEGSRAASPLSRRRSDYGWSLIGSLRECRGGNCYGAAHSSAPPTWKDRLGAALCSFLFPDTVCQRSTGEETPIARAVSGSLCVCVRKLRSLLILRCIRGRDHSFRKDGEYRYTRNTVESTGQ